MHSATAPWVLPQIGSCARGAAAMFPEDDSCIYEWPKDERNSDLSSTVTSGIMEFQGFVSRYHRAKACAKRRERNRIVSLIQTHYRPIERAEAMARYLARSSRPDALDDGIDVLARLSWRTEQLVWDRYREGEIPGHEEDYWYILIRGLGKCQPSDLGKMLIRQLTRSDRLAVREAAVEALADVGGSEAADRLVEIARTDPSPFIRGLARDRLEDCVR